MQQRFTFKRIRHTIVAVLVVALTGALIPPQGWGLLFSVNVAYAAPVEQRSEVVATSMSKTAQVASALIKTLPNEVAINFDKTLPFSGLPQPATSSATHADSSPSLPPLSISRVQSAYTPDQILSNILIVTFTVSNNQSPTIIPQLPSGATLTDTVQAWQSVDLKSDPNAIHNVLLVDSPASGAAINSSIPRADFRNDKDDDQHATDSTRSMIIAPFVLRVKRLGELACMRGAEMKMREKKCLAGTRTVRC